jgi:hypothetical protein
MQVKYNSRVKMNQVNARTIKNGGPFALGFTNTGIIHGECCTGATFVPKAPSHQQSYGLYLKRATMGIGLASRVVSYPPIIDTNKGIHQAMLTYKRGPNFTTGNYIDNKKSKALRCDYSTEDSDGCKPAVEPICYDSCGKKPVITQDLGYLSANQQINKKLSLRAGNVNENYEIDMMNSGKCAIPPEN